eukprot:357066-Chlamydomonas_euryale.AAC.7
MPSPASGESSKNGAPGSSKKSILSLGSSLPRARWRAMAFAPPPCQPTWTSAACRHRRQVGLFLMHCALCMMHGRGHWHCWLWMVTHKGSCTFSMSTQHQPTNSATIASMSSLDALKTELPVFTAPFSVLAARAVGVEAYAPERKCAAADRLKPSTEHATCICRGVSAHARATDARAFQSTI